MHLVSLGQMPPTFLAETLPDMDCGCGVTVPFGAICPFCDPATGTIDMSTIAGSYFEGKVATVRQNGKQICPLGQLSGNPLIPGVCNTTVLVAGVAALGLVLVMSGRK